MHSIVHSGIEADHVFAQLGYVTVDMNYGYLSGKELKLRVRYRARNRAVVIVYAYMSFVHAHVTVTVR